MENWNKNEKNIELLEELIDSAVSSLERRVGQLTLLAEDLLRDAEDANYRIRILNFALRK